MLGVCVGVAALITILSIMNGMEGEIRSRMLSLASHATLAGTSDQLANWRELAQRVRQFKEVEGVAPYVETQAMALRGAQLSAVMVRGVDPTEEGQVSDFGRYMKVGTLADLRSGSQSLVLGAGLAWTLQARVGDEVTLLIPQTGSHGGKVSDAALDLRPRMQTFTVTGIFEVAVQEHDNVLALVNMDDAAALLDTDTPSGLRLKFTDVFVAPTMVAHIAQVLAAEGRGTFTSSDWSRENASYFRAVRIEKTMMALIMMLIVAVAAFNIVAALVMVVNEKRNDIAILRTLGLPPGSVVAIFLTQGVLIGWFGSFLGVALGLSLAMNVDVIVPFLEHVFGMHIFDPDVYYITSIPSEVRVWQVGTIAGLAMLLTLLATLYPSIRGAHTEPADALRYE
jgi:lipoprotein-releasing system permease protein